MFYYFICMLAGIGAGVGTGLAGMSAAAVISPMLIAFLNFEPYEAVGIALASDVLASAVSAYTYGKSKNLDLKNGIYMLISVLVFTFTGSYLASFVSGKTMGNTAVIATIFIGIRFIFKPVMATENELEQKSKKERIVRSLLCGIPIGFICGFVGAGGGMMMLFILTSVLGYQLKTAVGTSVFIMTFTALTGAVSHFMIGEMPDTKALIVCVVSTFIAARITALFANKASPKTLNRVAGGVLIVVGIATIIAKYIM